MIIRKRDPDEELHLVDLDELDLKGQVGVLRDDWWISASTIAIVGGDLQDSLLTKRHLWDTLIPTLNDLFNTDFGDEGLVAVAGGIELGSIGKSSDVVHGDGVALLREVGSISGGDDSLGNAHC